MNLLPDPLQTPLSDELAGAAYPDPAGATTKGRFATDWQRATMPDVQPLEKRRLQCYLALMIVDIAVISLAFYTGATLYFGLGPNHHALMQAQLVTPIYLTIALYNGSYSVAALRDQGAAILKPVQAIALAALAMILLTYLSKTASIYSRVIFLMGVAGCSLLLPTIRMAMQSFVRWRCGDRVENILIVADGGPLPRLEGAMVVDARAGDLRPDLADPHALDRLSRLFAPMDRVLVCCEAARKADWARAMKGLSVEGEVIDEDVVRLGALGARHEDGLGFLLVSHRPLGLRDRAIKRLFDLSIAVPAVIVLAPLLVVVALLIRLEDGGPALFRQRRTGRGSRFFRIYKFRSMAVDSADAAGNISASREDGRITRIGRFIRSTSIDELPQLLNVIRGDMSPFQHEPRNRDPVDREVAARRIVAQHEDAAAAPDHRRCIAGRSGHSLECGFRIAAVDRPEVERRALAGRAAQPHRLAQDDRVTVGRHGLQRGRGALRRPDSVALRREAHLADAQRLGIGDCGLDRGLVVGDPVADRARLLDGHRVVDRQKAEDPPVSGLHRKTRVRREQGWRAQRVVDIAARAAPGNAMTGCFQSRRGRVRALHR